MSQLCPSRAVFDIETKEIGNPYEIEASAITIIVTDDGKLRYYDQDHIREAVEFLLACKGYVTYNGRRFDVPVLLKYMSRGEAHVLRNKPHFDIFFEMQQEFPGLRLTLNNFAKTTLNLFKLDLYEDTAPGMWRHDPEKLKQYNAWDTYLTYLLYIHTIEKGYLEFTYPKRRRLVPRLIGRTT